MRTLGLLASLLLLQCGPKTLEGDESGPGSGDTTVAASDSSGDTTGATTGTTTIAPTTTEPTTTGPTPMTTVGGECEPPNDANVWVCDCVTNDGPWTPFNEACGREPTAPTEWAVWLCENYADEQIGSTSGAGSTAGGEEAGTGTAGETAGDTGSLGCECTCEVTRGCCDDSLP